MSRPAPGTTGHRGPVCRVLTCLTTLAVLLLGLLPAPASADDISADDMSETAPMQVRLERVEPAIATPDTELTLTGTVQNLGLTTLTDPEVRVQVAYRGLDTRSALAGWADGSSTIAPGRTVATTDLSGPLEPDATRSFRLTVEEGEIEPPFEFATLPMTLSVGSATAEGGVDGVPGLSELGSLRTFLPWDLGGDFRHNPIDLAWVVPLTLPADADLFSTDARVRAQAWQAAVGPQSRVQQLMDGLADAPVTWMVDPSLLSPAEPSETPPGAPEEPTGQPPAESEPPPDPDPTGTQASPTETPDTEDTEDPEDTETPNDTEEPATPEPTGTPDGGGEDVDSPTAAADALLGRLIDDSGRSPLWEMPIGDPDLTAVLDLAPESSALRELVAASGSTDLGGSRGDVAWPAPGRLEAGRVAELQQAWSGTEAGLTAVIVSSDAVQDQDLLTSSAVQQGADGVTLLTYDERLSGLVAGAGDPDSGGASVQRLLAETLAIYQERPAADRSLLIAPPRGLGTHPDVLTDMVTGLRQAPWLNEASADRLLQRGPGASAPEVDPGQARGPARVPAPGDLTAYPVAEPSPLTAARLEEIDRSRTRVDGVAAILAEGDAFAEQWQPVGRQLYSTRWRDNPAGWDALHASIEEAVNRIFDGLGVNPTTVNFFADEGVLQVTVLNDLEVGVRDVRLEMVPRNGRLRITEQPEPVAIGPNSRTTVRFRVTAVAAGQVPVEAQLSTPNGTPLSEPEDLLVRVQPTSTWIYWALGIVAGLILVLGLYRSLRPQPVPDHGTDTDTGTGSDTGAGGRPPTPPQENPSR